MEDNLNTNQINIDRDWLQKIQDFYTDISGLFMFAIDRNGKQITDISGRDMRETGRIAELLDKNQVEDLFKRVMYTKLEEQIIENTEFSNLKLAAVAIKVGTEAVICFIVAAVYYEENGENAILNIRSTVDEQLFFGGLDYLREVFDKIYAGSIMEMNAHAMVEREHSDESRLQNALSLSESMNGIVQFLDSDDSYENICESIVKKAAEATHISHAYVLQPNKAANAIDVLGKYRSESADPAIERVNPADILKYSAVIGDKPMVVSSRTEIDYDFRLWIGTLGIIGFVVLPIFRARPSRVVSNYLIFADNDPSKVWTREDIKFFGEAAKVLQSIFDRHLHKLSIVASYSSLTFVLNNVGSAIYVKDIVSGNILFKNKSFESMFAREIENGSLDRMFGPSNPDETRLAAYFEVQSDDSKHWYDVNRTPMDWVDGRKVILFSIFDITDKKVYQEKIEQQANNDYLTGLYNRMSCEKDLNVHITQCKRDGKKGCLLYLDLDDFKHINDGLGHQYGDVLLKTISNKLNKIEGIKDSCYRMGGDEFIAIISSEYYDNKDEILETVRVMFNTPWFLKGGDYYCTSSIGVVDFPEDEDTVQEIIRKADIAMYESKRAGKNRTSHYKSDADNAASHRLDMEKSMRDAASDAIKEFEVYYQPIIDTAKGNICTGAEALLRWNSASLGFVTPGDFIPLAEYLGLINPIGNHVLRQACLDCKRWNESGHPYYKVNVNLSVVQLLQNDIVETVARTVKETGINPRNLTLEVTESLAINDLERMKKILNAIKGLGCRIALDDFGTGYSSLNHIRELPIDVIKVDQTFVTDLATDPYAQSFIRMVGELADALKVKICVEGIETEEQKAILDDMNVRMIQGFYFDRPMRRSAFEDKYVTNCIDAMDHPDMD
ncbi:MAG: bifunctional diguanylate cyclase/phosphodiesterase [Lachnospiraceae bacterium]|nr:bifunctional diguanylate cyclase/phosphodiesterase [Lachnospiraceae bacterium]